MTNPTPHGQVPEALPAIQRFEVVDCIDSKHVPAVIPKPHGPWVRYADHVTALAAGQAPKAAPGDALDEALRQRDDAEDFIDALLDEVLGHERPDWSNLYGRADALNDVQERMTSLHKPAVDKAWGQFQSAKATPQQGAQEPYAYAVYFPDQPTVELVHDLDDLIDDLTNRQHTVTKLYTAPQQEPAPLSEREAFESTWEKLYGKKPVLWDAAFKEAKMDVPAHSAGKYFYRDAQAAWKAWQARAALAAQGGK